MARRIADPVPIGRTAEDVRGQLAEMILSGSLQPGQRLGGERELAERFGVSRSSLRQALGVLEASGAIRRVPGRGGGTFVSAEKVDRDLSRIVGVPALLRDQGFTAGTRVVSAAVRVADPATAAALGLAPDTLVVDIVRIRLADGSPISLERVRLPADRVPGLLEESLGGSLYEVVGARYGITPSQAEERIEVVTAEESEAAILGVAPGAPLLSITRTTTDQDGAAFEYSHDLFRADRTRITVRSQGRGGTAGSVHTRGRVVELRARSSS